MTPYPHLGISSSSRSSRLRLRRSYIAALIRTEMSITVIRASALLVSFMNSLSTSIGLLPVLNEPSTFHSLEYRQTSPSANRPMSGSVWDVGTLLRSMMYPSRRRRLSAFSGLTSHLTSTVHLSERQMTFRPCGDARADGIPPGCACTPQTHRRCP